MIFAIKRISFILLFLNTGIFQYFHGNIVFCQDTDGQTHLEAPALANPFQNILSIQQCSGESCRPAGHAGCGDHRTGATGAAHPSLSGPDCRLCRDKSVATGESVAGAGAERLRPSRMQSLPAADSPANLTARPHASPMPQAACPPGCRCGPVLLTGIVISRR